MSEKTCKSCAHNLPLSAFPKHKGRKDGHAESCKQCRSAARKAHYAASAEERQRIALKSKDYYAANKERIAPKKAAYVQQNKAAHNERGRRWYHKNLDKARKGGREAAARYRHTEQGQEVIRRYHEANAARFKAYREANAERFKETKQAYYQLNKDAILAACKEYYVDNKPYILTRHKAYVAQNREVIRRISRAWTSRNPDASRITEMRRRVRMRAAGGQYVSVVTIRQLWHKQGGLCVYCRAKLGDSPKSKQTYHVDHIHPVSKGGTNEAHNLQCLCPSCNFSKGAKLPHVFAQERGRLFF